MERIVPLQTSSHQKAMQVPRQAAAAQEARPTPDGPLSCHDRMMNNLRQYFSSAVKRVTPLSKPRHLSIDGGHTALPAPAPSSRETPVKPGSLQKLLNPPTKRALPLRTPEMEPKGRVPIPSPPGLGFVGGEARDGVPTPRVLVKRVPYHSAPVPSHKDRKDNSASPVCAKAVPPLSREGAVLREMGLRRSLQEESDALHRDVPSQQRRNSLPPKMPPKAGPHNTPYSTLHKRPGSPDSFGKREGKLKESHEATSHGPASPHSPVNGFYESKRLLPSLGTAPAGGSSPVLGYSSVKRKGDQLEDRRGGKRPCSEGLGLASSGIERKLASPLVQHTPSRSSDGVRWNPEEGLAPKDDPLRLHADGLLPVPAGPLRPRLAHDRGLVASREVKENLKLSFGSPAQQSPLPHREESRDAPCGQAPHSLPPERRARRQLDVGSVNSPPRLGSRMDQSEREEKPSPANMDTSLGAVSPTKADIPFPFSQDPENPSSSTVRLAAGTDDPGKSVFGFKGSPQGHCPPPDRRPSAGGDGDLELSLGDLEVSSSSDSESEDEPLLSLQEILSRSIHPPATPKKEAFSEPSTPDHKPHPVTGKSKPVNYKNTLEQMLKEKEQNQRLKEAEMKLLVSCKEDLLKLAKEEEDSEGNVPDDMSHEHRAILQRYSIVSSAIPDVHPGEEVFVLSSFGRLFSQHSLDLRKCSVTPQNSAQTTLLQARPDELLYLISSGLLLKAFRCSPCHPSVTRWLFQMMSVHPDRRISTQILRSLKDIALIAAEQIVLNKSRKFEVWTPSVQDITLVFLNMGVPFVTLFPLEALQPPFTEGDILQGINCSEDGVGRGEHKSGSFPEHNFENVIKYLALCAALCPRAYSDRELLLLLTLVCRLSLETHLRLLPVEDLHLLLHHLVTSVRDWDTQLPCICLALTDLTEDHHNLRRLVQLLPDHKRGRQLRKHLSMSIISKLLNHRCTYKPTNTEFQLSSLRRYLPRMRPSSLLSAFFSGRNAERRGEEEDRSLSQDQQAYYLCYSLLALVNEASNFEPFPSNQKEQLQLLSAELEKHIKCDIRESDKCLYRSKVKDFVARIYTKWQVLLSKSRPLQGKLHDYWQPLPEDRVTSSQESVGTEDQGEEEEEEEPVMDKVDAEDTADTTADVPAAPEPDPGGIS
ncbi:SMC5-SMC6 complex localization factor protein 2 [Megalops cyprinoides]|uniref:SMC5-SMC6 complex localization factor protein 2 n=1 Tax=Megalops cyprinoides TaxID=118141 RepID=UPI0018654C4C|nr:SMC5-SMC6 complex localization factor protein 2 [Megalops cyprinoides]